MIRVVNVDLKIRQNGNLIGFFDAYFSSGDDAPELVIKGFKFVNGKKGRFVSEPQEEFTKRDGTKGWARKVEFPTVALREALLQRVEAEYQNQLQATGQQIQPQQQATPPAQQNVQDDLPF